MQMKWMIVVGIALSSVAFAQAQRGAKFGARDPRTCASIKEPQKGAPTGDQMTKVFICQEEGVTASVGGSETLHLLTNVNMQVGRGRPFSMQTDAWPDSDPSQPIYPVQGGYILWNCGVIGYAAIRRATTAQRPSSHTRRESATRTLSAIGSANLWMATRG